MSIYQMIRDHMSASIPYAAHTGAQVGDIGPDGAIATLAKTDAVLNHIGTVHAGALFTLGETASGAAMSGLLADKILEVRPVAANASIQYFKTAKTDLVAHGEASVSAEFALKALEADGKVQFDVAVSIRDAENVEVATMTVSWHVKKTS
jgi:acyl-coenzyme A thioesterase PaaI-like protein